MLSLSGQIEDLLLALGYEPVDLGNPDLKPDFVFRHDTKEAFQELREYVETIQSALSSLKKSLERRKSCSEPVTKKRSLE